MKTADSDAPRFFPVSKQWGDAASGVSIDHAFRSKDPPTNEEEDEDEHEDEEEDEKDCAIV